MSFSGVVVVTERPSFARSTSICVAANSRRRQAVKSASITTRPRRIQSLDMHSKTMQASASFHDSDKTVRRSNSLRNIMEEIDDEDDDDLAERPKLVKKKKTSSILSPRKSPRRIQSLDNVSPLRKSEKQEEEERPRLSPRKRSSISRQPRRIKSMDMKMKPKELKSPSPSPSKGVDSDTNATATVRRPRRIKSLDLDMRASKDPNDSEERPELTRVPSQRLRRSNSLLIPSKSSQMEPSKQSQLIRWDETAASDSGNKDKALFVPSKSSQMMTGGCDSKEANPKDDSQEEKPEDRPKLTRRKSKSKSSSSSMKFTDKSPRPRKASLRKEQAPRSSPLTGVELGTPRSPVKQLRRGKKKVVPPLREPTVSIKQPVSIPALPTMKGCLKHTCTATAEPSQESASTLSTRASGVVCFDERVKVRRVQPLSSFVAAEKLWYSDEDYAYFQQHLVKLIHFALDVKTKEPGEQQQQRHFPGLEKWIVALTTNNTNDDGSDNSNDSCESIQWVLTAQSMQRKQCEYDDTKIAEMYQALTMQSQMDAYERAKTPAADSPACIWF